MLTCTWLMVGNVQGMKVNEPQPLIPTQTKASPHKEEKWVKTPSSKEIEAEMEQLQDWKKQEKSIKQQYRQLKGLKEKFAKEVVEEGEEEKGYILLPDQPYVLIGLKHKTFRKLLTETEDLLLNLSSSSDAQKIQTIKNNLKTLLNEVKKFYISIKKKEASLSNKIPSYKKKFGTEYTAQRLVASRTKCSWINRDYTLQENNESEEKPTIPDLYIFLLLLKSPKQPSQKNLKKITEFLECCYKDMTVDLLFTHFALYKQSFATNENSYITEQNALFGPDALLKDVEDNAIPHWYRKQMSMTFGAIEKEKKILVKLGTIGLKGKKEEKKINVITEENPTATYFLDKTKKIPEKEIGFYYKNLTSFSWTEDDKGIITYKIEAQDKEKPTTYKYIIQATWTGKSPMKIIQLELTKDNKTTTLIDTITPDYVTSTKNKSEAIIFIEENKTYKKTTTEELQKRQNEIKERAHIEETTGKPLRQKAQSLFEILERYNAGFVTKEQSSVPTKEASVIKTFCLQNYQGRLRPIFNPIISGKGFATKSDTIQLETAIIQRDEQGNKIDTNGTIKSTVTFSVDKKKKAYVCTINTTESELSFSDLTKSFSPIIDSFKQYIYTITYTSHIEQITLETRTITHDKWIRDSIAIDAPKPWGVWSQFVDKHNTWPRNTKTIYFKKSTSKGKTTYTPSNFFWHGNRYIWHQAWQKTSGFFKWLGAATIKTLQKTIDEGL